MQKILITGGTGLIGQRLSYFLKSKGYEVRLLSREKNLDHDYPTYKWDISKQIIDEEVFSGIDYIIHLAGAGIADKKWSTKRKQLLIDSRVKSTNLLFETVEKLQIPIKAFISSSAIGYYGSVTNDHVYKEEHSSGNDFISKICKLWEKSASQFETQNIRTVKLRTGIVLSKQGGALSKMKTPIITPLGNSKQYMPWIHIDDLCQIYIKAIENQKMQGVYNAVAPEHHNNKSFSKIFAQIFKRPFVSISVPSFILKLIFGEMSTILLNGSKVSANKIQQTGFSFLFPKLKDALKNLK